MATYLKRTSKLFDITTNRGSANVNLRDLLCPVCRGILIEPVTLPCTHNLCLGCLKGTFEHNSLSCPLCRVRVGSWLRTATKSETLVNNELWNFIRTRFPKEVEGKHNGDEGDIELDSGFASKKVILSAAGEIRREYESQLRLAEEEMRRQRETERIANEALIRKIRAEEQQQQLAQLAQDQLLAKNLVKKQLTNKETPSTKYHGDCTVTSTTSNEQSKIENKVRFADDEISTNFPVANFHGEKKSSSATTKDHTIVTKPNVSMITKIRGDRYLGVKTGLTNNCKDIGIVDKSCGQKSLSVHNAVTRTLKHQTMGKFSSSVIGNFASEASCSNTQIYGSRSKEELHVPKDLLSSKKKSLGVEVCMTTGDDDERIGSAESAGSHDSINQEIHHFKPIKPIARTALKLSYDGRPIDPKLVRVVPILKRVSNAVAKAPSPTHVKRILGCSWSAFRGKARQNLEQLETSSNPEIPNETNVPPSTSSFQSPQTCGKSVKPQLSETVRRLDLAPEISFDPNNKNYPKPTNRTINGTKVSKRLIMDETPEPAKTNSKFTKMQSNKNGTTKNKRQRISWNEKKNIITQDDDDDDDESSSSCTSENLQSKIDSQIDANDSTMENIAERIKRRKINRETSTIVESEPEPCQRTTRRRSQMTKMENDDFDANEEGSTSVTSKRKRKSVKIGSKTKRKRVNSLGRIDEGSSSDNLINEIPEEAPKIKKIPKNSSKSSRTKNSRNFTKKITEIASEDENFVDCSTINDEINSSSCSTSLSTKNLQHDPKYGLDEQIIEEQKRMERLIIQEKEDFELALRLQSQFNDMERIAGRTRGSRRAMENNDAHAGDSGMTIQNSLTGRQRRRTQKHAIK